MPKDDADNPDNGTAKQVDVAPDSAQDNAQPIQFLKGRFKSQEAFEHSYQELEALLGKQGKKLGDLERQLEDQRISSLEKVVSGLKDEKALNTAKQREDESRKEWADRVGEDTVAAIEAYTAATASHIQELVGSTPEQVKKLADALEDVKRRLGDQDPDYVEHKEAVDELQSEYKLDRDTAIQVAKKYAAEKAPSRDQRPPIPPSSGSPITNADKGKGKDVDATVGVLNTVMGLGLTAEEAAQFEWGRK